MKAEVYIRCDGNSVMGLGHIVRCTALAHMLKDSFTVIFFCKDIPAKLQSEIIDAGIEVKVLKHEEDFFQHIKQSSIIVLDGYQFDTAYQQRIKQLNAQLVVIDDLQEGKYFADLIINQIPNVIAADYHGQPFTHFALGPEYALLREPFLEAASKERAITEITSVLICFGGADPKNFTQRVLTVALAYSAFKKIKVVIGQAFAHSDELMKLADSDDRVSVHRGLSDKEMAQQFSQTQLAIVPSSGILLEAIASHSIIISGFYVSNQRLVYNAYRDSFTDAGDFSDAALEKALNTVLQNPRPSHIKLDGLSGKRLIKKFKQLSEVQFITIRKASLDDLDTTFKWASDPAIRVFSFQQHQIKREEHEAWYRKKLDDQACVYFLVHWKKEIIGSVRFDVHKGQALISYLIDPAYHAKGFGLILLAQSFQPLLAEAKQRGLNVREIVGYVMKDNYPSRKTFVNLGFRELEEDGKLKYIKPIKA